MPVSLAYKRTGYSKCYKKQLRYIQWIEIYPMNNIIHPFDQLGPNVAVRG